jgi:hypothetical protein
MFLEHVHPSRVLAFSNITPILLNFFHSSPCTNPQAGLVSLLAHFLELFTLGTADCRIGQEGYS